MMDVQPAAALRQTKAGDEVEIIGGVAKAVAWPLNSGGDTCGDCPVGHDDCCASEMHDHCLKAEIVFRMKSAAEEE